MVKFFKFICFVLVIVFLSVSAAQSQFFFMKNPNIGKKISNFTLKTLKGKSVDFDGLRSGKKSILLFWTTWCPHCRNALKSLARKKQELSEANIVVILVNTGEKKNLIESYLKSNLKQEDADSMNILLDEAASLAENYDVIGLPTYFLIDDNGVVVEVDHDFDKYKKVFEKVDKEKEEAAKKLEKVNEKLAK